MSRLKKREHIFFKQGEKRRFFRREPRKRQRRFYFPGNFLAISAVITRLKFTVRMPDTFYILKKNLEIYNKNSEMK